MEKFEEILAKLENATRGNFVLTHTQRKILIEGIKKLKEKEG